MKKIIVFITLITSLSVFPQDFLMQNGTVNTCSGTFYDSGGAAGNYSDNESFIFTICPDTAGQLIQLNFTAWNTQLNADVMAIYNGPDTASPLFGLFSGAGGSPVFAAATATANPGGCLTIEFTSDAAATTIGWAATISCFEPCQTIISQIDSATPAPNADGYIRVCTNEQIMLEGSGQFSLDGTGATYEWDLGDGNTIPGQTATFSYPNPGVYLVNLNITDTNPMGCTNTNLVNQVVQVVTRPDFTGTEADDDTLCFDNNTTDITGVATAVEFIDDCTPPVSGTTFLPDGSGASYTTCITVDCYDSSQTLDDINQLIEICLNMEHSYLGDLDIFITSPSGQQVTLKSFAAGGAGTYLGGANDDNSNTPGVGADYCFAMSGAVTLVNGPTVIAGSNPPGNSIAPGTYLPEESFATLLGSPLNGDWCIEVIDNLAIDNGYIFSWGMNFDPALQPPELSFTPVITSESWDPDPSIINTVGNTITVQPLTAGIYCYTYRVTDDFGCEHTEEVCIELYPEVINDPPINLVVCDGGSPPYIYDLTQNESVVLASNPLAADFVVTFYETQVDADNDTNVIGTPGSYSGTDGQIIYVRIEYLATDCYDTSNFTLNISGLPVINAAPDLEECDDVNNDGFADFDLTIQDLGILGAQLPADFVVNYYVSFADADAGTNALVSPYTNIVSPQPVYVRVESSGNSNCYIASVNPVFELIVNPQALATQPNDMVVCDDISNDGIAQFDLDSQTATILGTQLPADYILTYHESQADADAGINALVSPYSNISNPQTIFVRVQEIANPVCFGTTSFELVVNVVPVLVPPTPLELCDDAVADGFILIDLSVKDDEIGGGNPNYAITYYLTQVDADTALNQLAVPYTNISNPQTIYARGQDINTGCYSTTTLTLNILPNPAPNLDTSDIELCDDVNTGDMSEVFDLTLNEVYIINGELGVSATYHESLQDAENGLNAIVNPTLYTNTGTPQKINVRVTNDVTGCYTLVDFNIIVNPLPDVVAVTNFLVCELNTDGFWDFDLESKTEEILNGQDPLLFVVTYHELLFDAQSGINALVSPYTNISNPQQIFVNITNIVTGCDIATVSFNIEVQEAAEANSDGVPILYVLCDDNMETDDDPTNDSVQFDLSTQNADILDGQDPLIYTVSYYATLEDADLGVNQLPTLYENIVNPQVIYTRVDNGTTIDSICYAVTSLTLEVYPLPVFDLEDEYILCVDTNGTEVIDPPVLDTDLSEVDYSFVWSLNGIDIAGATGSSFIPIEGGNYSVIVNDNITGCQNTDTTVVIESSPPIVTAVITTQAFADNHVIQATATGPGVYEFSLDDGPWQESGTFTNVSAGEHVVKARDLNGCGIGIATVIVIDYPLYFTPNGDGYHDTWNIVGIARLQSAKIFIFDRYGKLLKQLSPSSIGWNGTYNGEKLPSSDYWFTIEYIEPSDTMKKQFRAHFALKR